jgi:hypothetical protein
MHGEHTREPLGVAREQGHCGVPEGTPPIQDQQEIGHQPRTAGEPPVRRRVLREIAGFERSGEGFGLSERQA